jgi:hypothetical protein
MKIRLAAGLAVFLTCAATGWAQRDFLTSDEIEKVREAQVPADRLKLYVLFARQRMDEFEKLMAKEKKGRSLLVRDLLEDYTKIIEAIDTVSDDALKRKVDISLGTEAVQTAERNFAAKLRKIYDSTPTDLGLYDTAFKEAMATTLDSLELAEDSTAERAQQLSEREEKAKQDAKVILEEEDSKGKPAANDGDKTTDGSVKTADAGADPAKPKRKPPTLLRPGETVGAPTK